MKIEQVKALPPISVPVGVDIETTFNPKGEEDSANPYTDRMLSIQVSDGETVWILEDNFMSAVPLLANPEIKKVGQGFAFDLKFLRHNLGINIENIHDTLMAERVLYAGSPVFSHSLDHILSRRCGVYSNKLIREQFANHEGPFTEQQLEYMATDVFYLPKIREMQLQDASLRGLGRVIALENETVPVTADMILRGIYFDQELWESSVIWINQKKEDIKQHVAEYAEVPYTPNLFGGVELGINLNSPPQMLKLFQRYGYEELSTKEAVLASYLEERDDVNPILEKLIVDLLEWRGWEKMLNYDYPRFVNPVSRRIHPGWIQVGPVTGRRACKQPPVQQTKRPVKEEPNFRALFPPPPGYVYAIADYGQQEPRVLAQLSGDSHLLEAAQTDDMYLPLAERVYKKKIDKHDPERYRMKVGFLASVYGVGRKKLSRILGVSEEEAENFRSTLRATFPRAFAWGDIQLQSVVQKGFTTTALGRRRLFDLSGYEGKDISWRFGNEARNTPVQGTGGDILKRAECLYYRWANESGYADSYICISAHDELVVAVRPDDAEMILFQVTSAMRESMQQMCPDVKPLVDAGIRERWGKL